MHIRDGSHSLIESFNATPCGNQYDINTVRLLLETEGYLGGGRMKKLLNSVVKIGQNQATVVVKEQSLGSQLMFKA